MGCCNAIATEHGRIRIRSILYAEAVWCAQAVLSLHSMLQCMLCGEIVLLLNVADILYAGRLVSEHLFSGFE